MCECVRGVFVYVRVWVWLKRQKQVCMYRVSRGCELCVVVVCVCGVYSARGCGFNPYTNS